jgi:uncharacterized protein (TIGR02449 family)
MDDLFHHLERRIQAFLQKYIHMQTTNHTLNRNKLELAREKEQLLIKHKNAVGQIENMVTRLKSIEGLP